MKLFQYRRDGEIRLGAKLPARSIDVAETASAHGISAVHTLDELLGDAESARKLSQFLSTLGSQSTPSLDENTLDYAPCVTSPEKIICIGMNYRRHVEETKGQIPTVPVLFSKFSNTLRGAHDPVSIPANMQQADYEVELGIIIGREARNVSPERALEYVFGYCTINDLSARDWQFLTNQWLLGKTADGFLPIGPYVVTTDDIPDPQTLWLKTWVNGELRQNSSTADMIFSAAQIVSHISQYFTLRPGDIISTGTPEGVILGMAEKHWLQPGDEVIVEIENLGRCVTRFET